MHIASLFLAASAALHLWGLALVGVTPTGILFLIAALVYVGFYAGLRRGMRAVAWASFLCLLVGFCAAVAVGAGATGAPGYIGWAIAAADLGAILSLVVVLWAPAEAARA